MSDAFDTQINKAFDWVTAHCHAESSSVFETNAKAREALNRAVRDAEGAYLTGDAVALKQGLARLCKVFARASQIYEQGGKKK